MSHALRRRETLNADPLSQMLAGDARQQAQAILAAAKDGQLDAQVMLGQILLEGQGIQRDPVLALTWFRLGAAQGHAMAHNMLGRCLEHGWGTAQAWPLAARHYRHAAESGLDWAIYNYANLLGTGRGVALDHTQAFALYQRAAELGHAKSMNLVGRYLEDGLLGPADPQAALAWYQRSAEAGDFRGQFSYAALLAAQQQIDEALRWLRRALAHGNLNFLRASRASLLQATHPALRELALAYHARAGELGDESDAEVYRLALIGSDGAALTP